jgi:glucose-1-phosphatase
MPLKTLLFDMGNVLVFFSHDRMCRQIAEVVGCAPDEIRRKLFDSQLQWDFERGRISEESFHRQLETMFRRTIPFGELRRATADIFEPNTDIVPLLDRLKSQGLRLVLLSNTCITHYDWVRSRYDLLDRFDDVTVSFRAGAIKPEDAIYEDALTRIECAPGECFYTDDIPAYVEKGRTFGLQAETFTGVDELTRQLEQCGLQP